MSINRESAEKTALKYGLAVGEVLYFFSLSLNDIKKYYKIYSGRKLKNYPVAKAHISRKLKFLRSSFPIKEIKI